MESYVKLPAATLKAILHDLGQLPHVYVEGIVIALRKAEPLDESPAPGAAPAGQGSPLDVADQGSADLGG